MHAMRHPTRQRPFATAILSAALVGPLSAQALMRLSDVDFEHSLYTNGAPTYVKPATAGVLTTNATEKSVGTDCFNFTTNTLTASSGGYVFAPSPQFVVLMDNNNSATANTTYLYLKPHTSDTVYEGIVSIRWRHFMDNRSGRGNHFIALKSNAGDWIAQIILANNGNMVLSQYTNNAANNAALSAGNHPLTPPTPVGTGSIRMEIRLFCESRKLVIYTNGLPSLSGVCSILPGKGFRELSFGTPSNAYATWALDDLVIERLPRGTVILVQ